MKTKRKVVLVAFFTCAAVGAFAADSVMGEKFGPEDDPPVSLGGLSLAKVFTVPGSLGDLVEKFSFSGDREVKLSPSLWLRDIGNPDPDKGWNTWTNGYSGLVLYRDVAGDNPELPFSVTLGLPDKTKAFYLYVEPNFFGSYEFNISASNAIDTFVFSNQMIDGLGGATGFGFYTKDPNLPLTSVTVSNSDTYPDGFAIGQFGIDGPSTNAPDGGSTVVLLGLAALALVWTRRAVAR